MAYNKINKYKMFLKVIAIVNEHYDEDCMTYAGVFRKYVEPVYPMSYHQLLKIINTPGLETRLQAEIDKINLQKTISDKSQQLKLFDDDKQTGDN